MCYFRISLKSDHSWPLTISLQFKKTAHLIYFFIVFLGDSKDSKFTPVTPIQGPIFIKNDSVPVLPLYAYPKVYNGTFMQIPVSF